MSPLFGHSENLTSVLKGIECIYHRLRIRLVRIGWTSILDHKEQKTGFLVETNLSVDCVKYRNNCHF